MATTGPAAALVPRNHPATAPDPTDTTTTTTAAQPIPPPSAAPPTSFRDPARPADPTAPPSRRATNLSPPSHNSSAAALNSSTQDGDDPGDDHSINDDAPVMLSADDRREFNTFMKRGRIPRCHNDPVVERDGVNWFVLLPANRYLAMWDLFIFFLVLYVSFVSIFVISFMHEINTSNVLFWIERFLDIVFFLDIIVNFFTAYEDDVYVTRLPLIAKRYLRTWFFIDFIATVPWGLIALGAEDLTERALLSLPRMLRLLRLFKLFRIMRILRLKEVFTWVEVKLRLKYGHVQLVGLGFLITLIGHWVACLFYFFGILNQNAEDPASWIKEAPDSLYGQYIYSLYFSVYTITTIGYGDVVPRTVLERTYVTVVMLLGAACFAYSISKLSDIIKVLGASTAQEHDMMDRLTSFGERRKLPPELEFEIRRFLTYHYSIMHVKDEQEVLEVLSDQLTLKVLRHMFGPPLVKSTLFSGVCAGASDDSAAHERLDTLYCDVEEISHLDNDHVIFHEGDEVNGMYIVQRGNVKLLYADGRVEKKRKGGSFGEANLVVQGRRRATATCAGYTQLLFVPRHAVMQTLSQYPEALQRARKRDASSLWDDALVVLERCAHLDDVAIELRDKATTHLKQQGRLTGSTQRKTDSASGSGSKDEELAPVAPARAKTVSAVGSTPGLADRHRNMSVVELQRVVEQKDVKIRMLESNLLQMQQELDRIVRVLRQ